MFSVAGRNGPTVEFPESVGSGCGGADRSYCPQLSVAHRKITVLLCQTFSGLKTLATLLLSAVKQRLFSATLK